MEENSVSWYLPYHFSGISPLSLLSLRPGSTTHLVGAGSLREKYLSIGLARSDAYSRGGSDASTGAALKQEFVVHSLALWGGWERLVIKKNLGAGAGHMSQPVWREPAVPAGGFHFPQMCAPS